MMNLQGIVKAPNDVYLLLLALSSGVSKLKLLSKTTSYKSKKLWLLLKEYVSFLGWVTKWFASIDSM
jgi:hypothetical protein